MGQNAIKRWILSHGWQQASYLHEPGRGPENGLVGFWCDALERIAQSDAQFANTFGRRFHRFPVPTTPGSGRRSRRPNVTAPPIPFPGFGSPSHQESTPASPSSQQTCGNEHEGEGDLENLVVRYIMKWEKLVILIRCFEVRFGEAAECISFLRTQFSRRQAIFLW
ncbi:uncharacterized protein N7479_010727 [Penicillium vulpinum]|uniref:uncharacterized protein n=1 Tax=Penicillium vulpinum TaxID=29845 RepID=UPI00254706AA|nr:uncharacterized protein N7479_010727 [Penicillium vulpinum]KAJ5952314.1 hypothetical protein N7479_010727 [Penicillium vulpinum]